MSLDLSLLYNYCRHCKRGEQIHTQNITHNLQPMWHKAGIYDALYESEGQVVTDLYVDRIRRAVQEMETNFNDYQKLDSPNGWGLARNALPWLQRWLAACRANPGATIHVSK
jgi:hypothetical protein